MDSLLEPRSADEPSGPDLEYDPAFIAMEAAASPKAEQQMGSAVIEGEEPDHRETIRAALKVMERAHDLRAGVHFARAKLRTEGYEGFADGVAYLRGCLETWWETCHPRLDPDDDDDPTMRINTILGLSARDPTLRYLMTAPLAETRAFGPVSLRTIMIANGELTRPDGEPAGPDLATIAAIFRESDVARLRNRFEIIRAIEADLRAIDAVFDARTPGLGPDLDPLLKLVRRAGGQLAPVVGGQAEDPAAEAAPTEGAAAAVAPSRTSGHAAPGTIASDADVRAALDRIIAYYRQEQPSSPLPVLLNRARRLVGADFMTIMKDIAPDGVDAVRHLGGLTEEEE